MSIHYFNHRLLKQIPKISQVFPFLGRELV